MAMRASLWAAALATTIASPALAQGRTMCGAERETMAASAGMDVDRAARAVGGRQVAALYRRTRAGVQRAELRFDGLAGCLRTPGGGSSRQFLVIVEAGTVRTRVISPREGARLMGLPDDYRLPRRAGAALHLVGDGVAAPVVRRLAEGLLQPLALEPEVCRPRRALAS
jgi:DNA (cytosine-5)-methyltransferase 1